MRRTRTSVEIRSTAGTTERSGVNSARSFCSRVSPPGLHSSAEARSAKEDPPAGGPGGSPVNRTGFFRASNRRCPCSTSRSRAAFPFIGRSLSLRRFVPRSLRPAGPMRRFSPTRRPRARGRAGAHVPATSTESLRLDRLVGDAVVLVVTAPDESGASRYTAWRSARAADGSNRERPGKGWNG